jgi:hypothetical protein
MKDLDPAFRGSGQKEYPFELPFTSICHYDFFAFCYLHIGPISNLFPGVLATDFGRRCVVFSG